MRKNKIKLTDLIIIKIHLLYQTKYILKKFINSFFKNMQIIKTY